MHLLAGFGGGTCFGRRTEKRIVFHLAAEVGTTVAAFAKRLVGSFSRDHLLVLLADRGRQGGKGGLKEMADARGLWCGGYAVFAAISR